MVILQGPVEDIDAIMAQTGTGPMRAHKSAEQRTEQAVSCGDKTSVPSSCPTGEEGWILIAILTLLPTRETDTRGGAIVNHGHPREESAPQQNAVHLATVRKTDSRESPILSETQFGNTHIGHEYRMLGCPSCPADPLCING